MEMYKIVRLSVFAWITILLLMLMLDTIGMNIFFPSRYSHVYAKSVAASVGSAAPAYKSKLNRLGPEKKLRASDVSEEFEQSSSEDEELEEIEDICREIVCPSDQYCYIPKPGVAQCFKKNSVYSVQKELGDLEDLKDDSSSSESSQEEDLDDQEGKRKDKIQKSAKRERPQPASNVYNHSRIVHCPACPIGKGHMLCGTDNSTYSSMCRLEFHNCIHGTQVKFSCFGYCPCMKVYEKVMLPPSQTQVKPKTSEQENAALKSEYYKGRSERTMHIQLKKGTVAQRDNERGHNQALSKAELAKLYYRVEKDASHKKAKSVSAKSKKASSTTSSSKACGHEQLRSMGLRLLDWFAVVMGEEMKLAKKKAAKAKKNNFSTSYKHSAGVLSNLSPNKLLPNCERPVSFMFHHFDVNNDYRLSMKELYYLEHDEGEHCLEPYLIGCDEDGNGYLTAYEWCSCFNLRLQPCTYRVKHEWKVPPPLGAFVPQCTSSGQYRAVQCHASVGLCWCVEEQGNEIAGTRVRGRYPTCEKSNPTSNNASVEKKPRPHPVQEFEDDEDMELEDSLEDGHGSGHYEGPNF